MSGLTTEQITQFMEAMLSGRKVTVGDVIHLVLALISLEAKIEQAIATEKDAARRRKIVDAFKRRDLVALRELLFIRKSK